MSSDSEEEHERHPSPTSEDEPQGISRQPSHSSNPVLRQPVGFTNWGPNGPPTSTYNAQLAPPQGQYLPGQAPPQQPKPARKSKSKSKDHGVENSSSKPKRSRAPAQYIPYLPGDPPPFSATLSYANKPGATTFTGDASLYITNDRNQLPPHAQREYERSQQNPAPENYAHYYQPADKVHANGKRIMPYSDHSPHPTYPPGPSSSHHHQYEAETYQEGQLSQSSSGSGHKKKHRSSHRHRDNPDGHPPPREPPYPSPQSEYQELHSRQHQRPPPSSLAPPQKHPQPPLAAPGGPPSKPVPQLRILTLLIEDLRKEEGERDQLAEIRVSLKAADNPEDGFWVNAKDVCKELQSSPARIDGPAKAFTRRGKYRQYFLRVATDGAGEYGSANLRVEKERTIEVFIEAAPSAPAPEPFVQTAGMMTPISTNGAVSSPRAVGPVKRKYELTEPHEAVYASPQSQHKNMSPAYSHHSPQNAHAIEDVASPGKKRKLSPETTPPTSTYEKGGSADWNDMPVTTPTAPDVTVQLESPKQNNPTMQSQPDVIHSVQLTPSPMHIQSPRQDPQLDRMRATPIYPGLLTGSESHKHSKVDSAIIRWLKPFVTQEPGWSEFVESRRTMMTVGEQMKHYRFVQNKVDQFVGTLTPPELEDAGSEAITKTQVVAVFGQPLSWGDSCTETLGLTELYGPGGSRLEDPRVVAMIDEPPAVSTGMQAREYLKLLRQIDQQWDLDHGQ